MDGLQQSHSLFLERLQGLKNDISELKSQQNLLLPSDASQRSRSRSSSPLLRDLLHGKFVDDEVSRATSTYESSSDGRGNLISTPIAINAEYNYAEHHQQTCVCACHTESRASLQGLLGLLFVGYKGLPLMTRRCTNQACQRQSGAGVTVTYYFPQWVFVRRMISFAVQTSAMSGLQVRLRFPHVVSPLASIIYIAGFGTPAQLRFLFDHGLASPFDIHANTGATPLHVSICQSLVGVWG